MQEAVMDLNLLFHRHQVSIMRSAAAACPEARLAHRGLAVGYAERIALLQGESGVLSPFSGSQR
jgi:hypothetical protein